MPTRTKRDVPVPARLSCRLNSRIKDRAEAAAALLGQSMTAFTEAALEEKSETVFARLERIQMSERDFERFAAAIASPMPPTQELVEAMREYERHSARSPEDNW